MALLNLSFEIPDTTPGSAASWAVNSLVTTEEIAGFVNQTKPEEAFEVGWSNDGFSSQFADQDLEGFDFSPEFGITEEKFEQGWANDDFLFNLGSAGNASFDTTFTPGSAFEDFDNTHASCSTGSPASECWPVLPDFP